MEVTIERILPGGLGLAHADGQTLMVPLTAPGDRLLVHIERVKGTVAFASIKEILSPSKDRVEPPCPYFGRCGGCDFQQLTYAAQLQAKLDIIKDCLRRIGGLAEVPVFQIIGAPNEWHYRSRAQWQYDSIRSRLGYFESASRRVCDVAECAVLSPPLQQALEQLRAKMKAGALPDDARYFRAVLGDDALVVASDSAVSQDSAYTAVTRTVGNERYQLSAGSFFQTNNDLLPKLMEAALAGREGDSAVELYCGVGLFTIPLARRFHKVTAIEDDSDAAEFARFNLEQAGADTAQVIHQDVGDWFANNLADDGGMGVRQQVAGSENAVDFLLLDPPRTGAESRVIEGIIRIRPKHICYVSCDPATLARDLKKLLAKNYTVDSLVAFDMFPQTHHVETVVQLSG